MESPVDMFLSSCLISASILPSGILLLLEFQHNLTIGLRIFLTELFLVGVCDPGSFLVTPWIWWFRFLLKCLSRFLMHLILETGLIVTEGWLLFGLGAMCCCKSFLSETMGFKDSPLQRSVMLKILASLMPSNLSFLSVLIVWTGCGKFWRTLLIVISGSFERSVSIKSSFSLFNGNGNDDDEDVNNGNDLFWRNDVVKMVLISFCLPSIGNDLFRRNDDGKMVLISPWLPNIGKDLFWRNVDDKIVLISRCLPNIGIERCLISLFSTFGTFVIVVMVVPFFLQFSISFWRFWNVESMSFIAPGYSSFTSANSSGSAAAADISGLTSAAGSDKNSLWTGGSFLEEWPVESWCWPSWTWLLNKREQTVQLKVGPSTLGFFSVESFDGKLSCRRLDILENNFSLDFTLLVMFGRELRSTLTCPPVYIQLKRFN